MPRLKSPKLHFGMQLTVRPLSLKLGVPIGPKLNIAGRAAVVQSAPQSLDNDARALPHHQRETQSYPQQPALLDEALRAQIAAPVKHLRLIIDRRNLFLWRLIRSLP